MKFASAIADLGGFEYGLRLLAQKTTDSAAHNTLSAAVTTSGQRRRQQPWLPLVELLMTCVTAETSMFGGVRGFQPGRFKTKGVLSRIRKAQT